MTEGMESTKKEPKSKVFKPTFYKISTILSPYKITSVAILRFWPSYHRMILEALGPVWRFRRRVGSSFG